MSLIKALTGSSEIFNGGNLLSASTTYYFGIGQGRMVSTATENEFKLTLRNAGVTARDLTVRVATNDRGTSTARFRKNLANGNQAVSIGASSTGVFTDSSNTDTVIATDTINASITTGAGGTTFRAGQINLTLEGSNVGTSFYSICSIPGITANSTTRFAAVSGDGNSTSLTESEVQQLARTGLTQRGLSVYVSTNTRATSSTVKSRVATLDGNQSISIGAGSTGIFSDASNSDSISLGTLFCYSITTSTGGGTLTFSHISSQNDSSSYKNHLTGSYPTSIATSTTTYFPGVGQFRDTTTELDTKTPLRIPGTISKLRVEVYSNGVTATSTLSTRVNGGAGAQSISIGSGATGSFEDASNSDSIAVGDTFNYKIVTGGTGTTIRLMTVIALFNTLVDPTFSASPSVSDYSDLTKVSSGHPAQGNITFWYKRASATGITSLAVRVGSSSVDYTEVSFVPIADINYHFISLPLTNGTTTGTPDWTAINFIQVVVVKTSSSSIKIDDIRMTANGSFTLYNLTETVDFSDIRVSSKKPTILIDTLAKALANIWYVDYERDIHFVPSDTDAAPQSVTDNSANFYDLKVDVDTSNLGNRIVVNGGTTHSSSTYSQVFKGDDVTRNWILKSPFADLVIKTDNNTTTHAAEVGTTTTNIKITGHGLLAGDWVVNRTRGEVRQIQAVVDADNVTVQAVASQTSTDTISYFATTPTDGVEGFDNEASFDYMANSSNQSVRASAQTAVLPSTTYIQFSYVEVLPVQIQYTDSTSITALKLLGLGDGIFDLASYTDRTIKDSVTALLIAQAKVQEFSNPVITGSFKTDQRGFKAGQLLTVNQSTGRKLSNTYVIQRVTARQESGEFQDYVEYTVTFATTLFGWVELMQKLLKNGTEIADNTDQTVETFVTNSETPTAADADAVALNGGFIPVTHAETPTAASSDVITVFTPPWHWEASVGQPVTTRWNLFSWS